MNDESIAKVQRQARNMWVAVAVLLALILANFGFVFARPDSQTQTIVGPVGPVGNEGPRGPQGPPPSDEQISEAVREYCSNTRSCDGKSPTMPLVLAAVSQYCGDGKCAGPQGAKGSDAQPVTDFQVFAAVSAYCANNRCKGDIGNTGATGATGPPGPHTVINCVIRSLNESTARYVAWKYETEPDTAHRDIYKVHDGDECVNPINLT